MLAANAARSLSLAGTGLGGGSCGNGCLHEAHELNPPASVGMSSGLKP